MNYVFMSTMHLLSTAAGWSSAMSMLLVHMKHNIHLRTSCIFSYIPSAPTIKILLLSPHPRSFVVACIRSANTELWIFFCCLFVCDALPSDMVFHFFFISLPFWSFWCSTSLVGLSLQQCKIHRKKLKNEALNVRKRSRKIDIKRCKFIKYWEIYLLHCVRAVPRISKLLLSISFWLLIFGFGNCRKKEKERKQMRRQ